MSDARTKLDILYHEVLGDIGDVIKRVEGLAADVENKVQTLNSGIELQTGVMLTAADELKKVLVDLMRQVDEYAAEATNKAAESSKAEIRQVAGEATATAVAAAVGREVGAAVENVQQATRELHQVAAAVARGRQAGTWQTIAGSFLAAIAGAGIVASVLVWGGQLPAGKPATLSAADARTLANGHALERIWNQLTPKERDRINELAKASK